MTTITTIPLDSQVLAVLRVRRLHSRFNFCDSEEIALQLDRPRGTVVMRLNDLYDSGHINRITDSIGCTYRVSEDGERSPGCCCCCNAKLIATDSIFCQTCGPEFSGRV